MYNAKVMEPKPAQLRVFVAAAETGSLRGAADTVGRSGAAVSMALKQLEAAVGGPLFEGDRKDALTDLGRYLLETARAQLAGYDRAMAGVRAFARGEAGRISLVCVPSFASRVLPDVIVEFIERRPGVELDVRDADTASAVRAVESGAADFGVAGRPRLGVVSFRPLFSDRLVLVTPATGRLAEMFGASGRPAPWSLLAGESFITNGVMENSADANVQALHKGAKLMVRNVTSLLALVRAGAGSTLLPALASPGTGAGGVPGTGAGGVSGTGAAGKGGTGAAGAGGDNDAGLACLEIGQPRAPGAPAREVGLLRKTGAALPPAARAFITVLEKHAKGRGG